VQKERAIRYILSNECNLSNEYNHNVSYDDINPIFCKYYNPKRKERCGNDECLKDSWTVLM